MPVISITLLLLFLGVIFPLRAVVQKVRFGYAERAEYNRSRPVVWWVADVLFLLGFVLVLLGPVAQPAGFADLLLDPGWPLVALASAGLVLATALAVWAQEAMGKAWRPDLPPADGTSLVTTGPFRLVRNPNYTAMLVAASCGTAIAATWVGVAGIAVLLASLELTARSEEPLLQRRFGESYRDYSAKTGRFVPGVGRITVERA